VAPITRMVMLDLLSVTIDDPRSSDPQKAE